MARGYLWGSNYQIGKQKNCQNSHLSFFHYFLSILPYTIWQNCHFCQIVSLSPNCIQLSSYPHFSTKFTDKILYLSAKNHNILFLFTYNSGNPWLLPKGILLPNCINRPSISGIKNPKKRGPPTTPVNPSTLKIPWFQAISLYFRQIVLKFLWHQLLIAAWAAVKYFSNDHGCSLFWPRGSNWPWRVHFLCKLYPLSRTNFLTPWV